jgi:hypothetical protein
VPFFVVFLDGRTSLVAEWFWLRLAEHSALLAWLQIDLQPAEELRAVAVATIASSCLSVCSLSVSV